MAYLEFPLTRPSNINVDWQQRHNANWIAYTMHSHKYAHDWPTELSIKTKLKHLPFHEQWKWNQHWWKNKGKFNRIIAFLLIGDSYWIEFLFILFIYWSQHYYLLCFVCIFTLFESLNQHNDVLINQANNNKKHQFQKDLTRIENR